MKRKRLTPIILYIGLTTMTLLLTGACKDTSRRAEIESRREALRQHQDSALAASQQELAWVDSALQAANARYDALLAQLADGQASEQEITQARLHRDSLQVQFETLCAKIKYIHRKQKEVRKN